MTNNQIEAERVKFEAWYVASYDACPSDFSSSAVGVRYATFGVQRAWESWLACAEPKQAEIEALEREAAEADKFGLGVELALVDVPYTGSHVERIRRIVGEWAEGGANSPWLTVAHTLCTDAGIPQGRITERIEALRGLVESLRKVCAAAEKLSFEAEEYDFPDGWGQGAAMDLWNDLDAAIDAAMKEGK